MTFEEKEIRIHEFQVFIADKYKDIQLRSQELKHPDDKTLSVPPLKRIKDDIDDVLKAFDEIDYLMVTDIDEFSEY